MLAQNWYQIGNLSVPSTWLAFLIAALVTGGILWFLFGRSTSNVFADYLFYFVITWKLSILITDFSTVIKHPLTILYYSSGTTGVYLGIAAVITLFFMKKEKRVSFGQIVETYILFYALFFMFVVLLNNRSLFEMVLIVALTVIYLLAIRFISKEAVMDRLVSFLVLYTFVHMVYGAGFFTTTLLSAYLLGIVFLMIGFYKKKWNGRKLSLTMTMLLLSAGVWAVYDFVQSKESVIQDSQTVNRTAMNFTARNLEGDSVQLSDYEGKKVVLNFWATWCPPCKAEMPHMQKYYEEYADKHNAEIVAVNLTSQDGGEEQIEQFVSDYQLDFPVLLDEDGSIASMYSIMSIPTTFILDEEGYIMKEIKGPISMEFLVQQLAE